MELSEIRKSLDRIDENIFRLIAQRMDAIRKVSRFKLDNGVSRYDAERERVMVEAKKDLVRKLGIDEDLAQDVMSVLLKHSHKLQREMGVV